MRRAGSLWILQSLWMIPFSPMSNNLLREVSPQVYYKLMLLMLLILKQLDNKLKLEVRQYYHKSLCFWTVCWFFRFNNTLIHEGYDIALIRLPRKLSKPIKDLLTDWLMVSFLSAINIDSFKSLNPTSITPTFPKLFGLAWPLSVRTQSWLGDDGNAAHDLATAC